MIRLSASLARLARWGKLYLSMYSSIIVSTAGRPLLSNRREYCLSANAMLTRDVNGMYWSIFMQGSRSNSSAMAL